MPCTEDAISLLSSRGITVVPDLIANAGGVIAAAYEMRSRRTGFPVQRDELLADVERRIAANTVQVLTKAEADGSTTHAPGATWPDSGCARRWRPGSRVDGDSRNCLVGQLRHPREVHSDFSRQSDLGRMDGPANPDLTMHIVNRANLGATPMNARRPHACCRGT